jgi:hypothetical protein
MFNALASFGEYELDVRREYWRDEGGGEAAVGQTPIGRRSSRSGRARWR